LRIESAISGFENLGDSSWLGLIASYGAPFAQITNTRPRRCWDQAECGFVVGDKVSGHESDLPRLDV